MIWFFGIVQIYLAFFGILTSAFGKFDKIICQNNEQTSCSHQFLNMVDSQCIVEFIKKTDCPLYDVHMTYDPHKLPFHLISYQDKSVFTAGVNLTFPNPKFKKMMMQFRNLLHPNYMLCRSFNLDRQNTSLLNQSLFWDCLMFDASVFEGGFYILELMDDQGSGGSYSFKVPAFNDLGQNISNHQTFFFIHRDYLENTGRLVITIQAVPFPVVSYNVSVLSCSSNDFDCKERVAIRSTTILPSTFFVKSTSVDLKTVDLGLLTKPGWYAVSVEVVSSHCHPECEVSLSSIYVIHPYYGLQIIGVLHLLMLISAFTCLAVLYKLRQSHKKWEDGIKDNPVSVLFVYHPDSPEMYKLMKNFAQFLKEECYVLPLLVDEQLGNQNPNQWTENQLLSAKRVLFFIPNDESAESVTPIKKQYECALSFFSSYDFPRKNGQFCSIIMPYSICESSKTLRVLRNFNFPEELPSILNWLHGESVIYKFLFWKSFARKWENYLSMSLRNVCKLSELKGSEDVSFYQSEDAMFLIPTDDSVSNSDSQYKKEVSKCFDGCIPDVDNLRLNDRP